MNSHPVKIPKIATQSKASPRSQDSLALESRSKSIPLPKMAAAPKMKGGKGPGKGKAKANPSGGPPEESTAGKAKAAPKRGGKR